MLKLHIKQSTDASSPNQEYLINLAVQLEKLQKLCLFEISLNESTLVEIVRLASNLAVLHVHLCIKFSSSLVRKIVAALETKPRKELLKLFVDSKEDWEMFQDSAIKKLLKVDFDCDHPSFEW